MVRIAVGFGLPLVFFASTCYRMDMANERAVALDQEQEGRLLQQSASGDSDAYAELVRHFHGKIYGLVYHMTANREDTEDLVQDIFVKGFASLKQFRGQSSFYTWLYRIAVNLTINFLKKRGRKTTLSLDHMEEGVERDPAYVELMARQTPLRDALMSELQEKLNEALSKVSEKHRAVVVLHDIQGISHEEIGQMLGCSPGTVRSRLFYARQCLQAELAEYLP